jgi:quercetin dioxygenase-like cupin family protein
MMLRSPKAVTEREFKMSISPQTSIQPRRKFHERLSTPDGTLIEILASPEEVGDEICLIRGTVPPGVAVPLHSHPDLELFYVLEGTVESFQSKEGTNGWTTAGVGDVVAIPGNVKHAWRNASSFRAIFVIVTTSKLCQFFREVTKPFDPNQRSAPPTPEAMERLFATAARYGYWMASPEENAAIGISL